MNQGRIVERQWRPMLRRLNIRPRAIYQARHTFISFVLSAETTINWLWLSKQVGTSMQTIERHYAKFIPREGLGELNKLNGALGRVEGENGTVPVKRRYAQKKV